MHSIVTAANISSTMGNRTASRQSCIGTFTLVVFLLPSFVLGFSPGVASDAPISWSNVVNCKTEPFFSPCRNPRWKQAPGGRPRKTKCGSLVLLSSENGNTEAGRGGQMNSKRSVARTGGRKAREHKLPPSDNNTTPIAFLRQWVAPLLIFAVLLRLIFGGMFFQSSGNPNYVYYSRSVYQSTTYSRDGNVETKRKETFQSNIPGLVETSKDRETQIFESALDDELLDIEDEIFKAFNFRSW